MGSTKPLLVLLTCLILVASGKKCANCDVGKNFFAHEPIEADLDDPVNKFGETKFSLPLEPEFDARKKWPQCALFFQPMGKCQGAAMRQAELMTLGFRFCVHGKSVKLSLQDAVSCDGSSHGCHGGNLDLDWRYLESKGVVAEDCFPFISATKRTPYCLLADKCVDEKVPWKKYKCAKDTVRRFTMEKKIKQEIVRGGPVMGFFLLRDDMRHYKDGVYTCQAGEKIEAFLTIIGWGEDDGKKYWLCMASNENFYGNEGIIKMPIGSPCPKLAHVMSCEPEI